jgi:phosphatidate cytidylyltransferase
MTFAVEPILLAMAVLLGVGGVLLAAFSLTPATAAHARPLWPTFVTELVIVMVPALAFRIGGHFLTAALALLAWRVSYEALAVALARLSPAPGGRPPAIGGAVLALGALALASLPLPVTVTAAALLMAAAALVVASRRGLRDTWPNALAEILLFPVLPMAMFLAAAIDPVHRGLVLLLFLLVETFDSYALLGGKLFGKTAAFPRLSPRKTIEGLACGAACLALTAAILGPLLYQLPAWIAVAGALGVGLLATAGDLLASRLKRVAGVKDYPFLMPRQGGLFDIVDAWLMTGAGVILVLTLLGRA